MVSTEDRIIIVGAGVFGLSTALWLSRNGYKNITIYDRCTFDEDFYGPSDGCDGASVDINKVFRMAYGEEQLLGPARLLRGKLAKHGNVNDENCLRSISEKWAEKYHMIDGIKKNNAYGFIDINAGITIADKACVYARLLCEKPGVRFVLGGPQGKINRLIVEQSGSSNKVKGIKTLDGRNHFGDLVIIAAGSWTASIIPEARQTAEATAGTVIFIDIPLHRQDLRKKFYLDNYPVWSYRRGECKDYYQGGGFPISKSGRLKLGYRGKKVNNSGQCCRC